MIVPARNLGPNRQHNLVQPLRFAFVGVLNTVVDLILFLVLASVLDAPGPANIISYSCGATMSYLLNRNWTFSSGRNKLGHRQSIKLFVLLTLVMIVISTVTTVAFAGFLPLAAAKLISVAVVACLSFISMKFLVFPDSGTTLASNEKWLK